MHYYNCLINIQITFCNRNHNNIIYFTSRSVHIDTESSLKIINIMIIFINLQLVNERFYKYSPKLL